MVNWGDPAVGLRQADIATRITHILSGIMFWEISMSLPYEWSYYSGKRDWKWTMTLYVACRYLLLIALITDLVIFNMNVEFNCMAVYKFQVTCAYVSVGLITIFLLLRAVTFWRNNLILAVFLSCIVLAYWGTLVHAIVVAEAMWVPASTSCMIVNVGKARLNTLFGFSTNLALLLISFAGLLRSRGKGRLVTLLFTQGIMYMISITLAFGIASTFLLLNLNDSMSYMFEPVTLVVVVIGSTRMYRCLGEFEFGSTSVPALTRSIQFGPNDMLPTHTISTGIGGTLQFSLPNQSNTTHASEQQADVALDSASKREGNES